MATTEEFIATGRRKTSVARIRMTAGNGKIDVNGKTFEEYFPTIPLQNTVLQPLQTVTAVQRLRPLDQRHWRRRHRPGRRRASRDCARAPASGCKSSRHPQGRRPAPPRSAHERTEKIRPARRAQALPVLQALIAIPQNLWRRPPVDPERTRHPAPVRHPEPRRRPRDLAVPLGHTNASKRPRPELLSGFYGVGATEATGLCAAAAGLCATAGALGVAAGAAGSVGAAGTGVATTAGFNSFKICVASIAA